ncbi:MAG: iron ABC transporter permease [Ancrocorticia sp.]
MNDDDATPLDPETTVSGTTSSDRLSDSAVSAGTGLKATMPERQSTHNSEVGTALRKRLPNFWVRFSLTVLLLLVVMLGSFMVGRFAVDPWEAVRIVAAKVLPIEPTWSEMDAKVVWDVRWPRLLMAVLVGAALSCSGAAYQGVFRNPLVSPDILGVAAASSFGAALGIILHDAYSPSVQVYAFLCGILGVACAYFLAYTKGSIPNTMLILAGVVTSSLFNAGVSVMKYLADPYDDLPAITFWLMGSLSGMRWENLLFAAPVIIVAMIALWFVSWRLNILTMGDDEARSLGINTTRLKVTVIICATALTATAVSQCGAIGWIGLVIPHMARMVVGPDHRKLIPTAAVLGATFLLLIDNLTRTASETSLPLSIPIAFIGAPVFAILLRNSTRQWS